jgi:hypothetical protein
MSASIANVSASTVPIVQNVTTEIKEKKPRKPTLPAKFGKFIQFGYWLIQSFKDDDGNFSVDSEDEFIEAIHLYDSVDAQQEFVQDFFDDSKALAKNIRKMILDKTRAEAKAAKAATKPPKAPKEPKEKVVKEPKEKVVKEPKEKVVKEPKEKVVKEPKEKVVKEPKEKVVKEPKEKVVKEPKEKVVKEPKEKVVKEPKTDKEAKVTVVSEPVVVEDTVLQPVVADKPKKGKAKKTAVDDQFVSEVVSLANAVVTSNDTKPKRKYNKKSNNDHDNLTQTLPLTLSQPDTQPEPEPEPELSVSVFDFQGKQFLIDDHNRVFDFHSHLLIGTFLDNHILPI